MHLHPGTRLERTNESMSLSSQSKNGTGKRYLN
jgi:hypothetical protein